jgi:hypothetical protein
VKPVQRRDLVVLAAGMAVAAWLMVRAWYGSLPTLDWWLPAPLAVLAVAEALGARTLKGRLAALREARARSRRGEAPGPPRTPAPARAAAVGRPDEARPVDPLLVARLAVLAQASAYVGAVFGGIWTGVLLYVGPAVNRLQDAGGDTVTAVIGIVCSAGLVVAALWLESVCRVPPSSDRGAAPLPDAD